MEWCMQVVEWRMQWYIGLPIVAAATVCFVLLVGYAKYKIKTGQWG